MSQASHQESGQVVEREWITCSAAARRLRMTSDAVKAAALHGAVAVLAIPGSRVRYSRTDIERLASAG